MDLGEAVDGPGRERRETWLAAALLVLLPALVFANTLRNGYHLDDFYRVVGNPELERFWPPHRHFLDPRTSATLPHLVQYRPLLPLSLSVDVALADEPPAQQSDQDHGQDAPPLAVAHPATGPTVAVTARAERRRVRPPAPPPALRALRTIVLTC